MKLPFHKIFGPMIKPYLTHTKLFCSHPTFSISIPYTYIYGILGLCISALNLKKHIGELPVTVGGGVLVPNKNNMIAHDLKIIATSMGLVQYMCLLIGCLTENPALFLPHLTGQILMVAVKVLNTLSYLLQFNFKSLNKLRQKITVILLLTFNWLQEFCVFRQYLCVCDL